MLSFKVVEEEEEEEEEAVICSAFGSFRMPLAKSIFGIWKLQDLLLLFPQLVK